MVKSMVRGVRLEKSKKKLLKTKKVAKVKVSLAEKEFRETRKKFRGVKAGGGQKKRTRKLAREVYFRAKEVDKKAKKLEAVEKKVEFALSGSGR